MRFVSENVDNISAISGSFDSGYYIVKSIVFKNTIGII